MGLYQHRLLTEGIRVIERNSPSDNFNADYSGLNFEKALIKRTQLAEIRYQVAPVLAHFKQLFKRFTVVVCLFFVMIGASSVSQFLVNDTSTQINFFWALLLFIVPNLISLVFWFILFFKKVNLNFSWFAHLSLSVIGLLDKLHYKLSIKHPDYTQLFQFYFEHRFSSYMGRIQLSFISHLWWTCYLFGATCSLLLVLATHQVDFIWETTILNGDVFAQITSVLTFFPNLLGISVPQTVDVNNASISIVNSLQVAQESRINWSNLMIFSLIIYGLLPRIILVFIFKQQMKSEQQRFKINVGLPYYVQLKNLLLPIGKRYFISDPDLINKSEFEKIGNDSSAYNTNLNMPMEAYPLAIELSDKSLVKATQHSGEYYETKLINIVDSYSQQQSLSDLVLSDKSHIVFYVDLQRVPDRGWLNLVNKCRYKEEVIFYLIVLGEQVIQEDHKALMRLQDWIEVAIKANIAPSCITYITGKLNQDEVNNG